MTAPTRAQIWDWTIATTEEHGETMTDAWVSHFAALAFAAGSRSSSTTGAELVREVEEAAKETAGGHHTYPARRALEVVNHPWWPRLRTALLSGSRSGEDARDAARFRSMAVDAETLAQLR